MTEWGVFGVIVAIVAFVVTVVTPIIKLNSTIIKLTTIVENMSRNLEELTERNSNTHSRIFDKLNDHETRITVLEKGGKA